MPTLGTKIKIQGFSFNEKGVSDGYRKASVGRSETVLIIGKRDRRAGTFAGLLAH